MAYSQPPFPLPQQALHTGAKFGAPAIRAFSPVPLATKVSSQAALAGYPAAHPVAVTPVRSYSRPPTSGPPSSKPTYVPPTPGSPAAGSTPSPSAMFPPPRGGHFSYTQALRQQSPGPDTLLASTSTVSAAAQRSPTAPRTPHSVYSGHFRFVPVKSSALDTSSTLPPRIASLSGRVTRQPVVVKSTSPPPAIPIRSAPASAMSVAAVASAAVAGLGGTAHATPIGVVSSKAIAPPGAAPAAASSAAWCQTPTSAAALSVEEKVEAVKRFLPAGPYLCVLGGTQFTDPSNQQLVTAIAKKVLERLNGKVTVLTGGMQGIQAAFAKALGSDFKALVNLLPKGQASNYGVGQDIAAGSTLEERMEIFGMLGQVYLSVEGGPGVAKEARAACGRGAAVVPVVTTGGASAGMFNFPTAALEQPPEVSDEQWKVIREGKDAEAVASVVVELLEKKLSSTAPDAGYSSTAEDLQDLLRKHPYLDSMVDGNPHPLVYWVRQCRSRLREKMDKEAAACLQTVKDALETEKRQIAAAFRRFDVDGSGKIEADELTSLCGYLGWSPNIVSDMDVNKDSVITEDEFIGHVGRLGGMSHLFRERRRTVEARQFARFETEALAVGNRVRSFYYLNGKKSAEPQEAQILQVRVKGLCVDAPYDGVRLAFGFGQSWTAKQVVPPFWILPDTTDSSTVAALRECGIMDEQQAFWASVFPPSELRAVERLTDCQRKALSVVRSVATEQHEKALPDVRKKFKALGLGEEELQATLQWVQDLAPMCVHIHIDKMGRFMESDDFYRSQFETHTSCGALDDKNETRQDWEKELFGGTYDGCKPFERCKYGALSVMNDYRGVTSAYQYGDSYLVLKDVRLRCTFASTDSGGLEGNRLAVLDKYAHVLNEYDDDEIKAIVKVAMSAKDPPLTPSGQAAPQLLRGTAIDPSREWVTLGFPSLQQQRGCFYFEVHLDEGCRAPQVGILSSAFTPYPYITEKANVGVGDDPHGWAVDGQHAARWKRGQKKVWGVHWPSKSQGQKLSEKVVVGIAVDLDERKVWVQTNGTWDVRPAFEGADIPTGLSLYPAVSVNGGGSFNFGSPSQPAPSPPPRSGKSFTWWPSAAGGIVHMDCPLVGDSDVVHCYKEIQIHGEVNFPRNVQRLVANRKHLECKKQDRSWALTVSGAGRFDGSYHRHGAHADRPTYKSETEAFIYYNPGRKQWCIAESEDYESWSLSVPVQDDEESFEPPLSGWKPTVEQRGVVTPEAFKAAVSAIGVPSTNIASMVSSLSGTGPHGSSLIYRAGNGPSFQELWDKLPTKPAGVNDADAAWEKVVEEVKSALLQSKSYPEGTQVVETKHPYPADATTWSKSVEIDGAKELAVQFASQTRTLEYYASFEIDSAGFGKLAQNGMRVQFASLGSISYIVEHFRGTMQAKNGKFWNVKVDRAEVEHSCRYSAALPETGDIIATCASEEDVKSIAVKYEDGVKVSDEISEFVLMQTMPFTPFGIKSFKSTDGPAQKAGVEAGWFLDIAETLFGDDADDATRQALADYKGKDGEDLGEMPCGPWDNNLFSAPEKLFKRLAGVADATGVRLVFVNALKGKVLPQAFVTYPPGDKTVGDDIESFSKHSEDEITIDDFKDNDEEGPARKAGVQEGWRLRIDKTLGQKEGAPKIEKKALLEDLDALLKMSGVNLIFEPNDLDEPHYFRASGDDKDEWKDTRIRGGSALFKFNNQAAGAGSVEERWGVFALVTPLQNVGADLPVSKEDLDSFATEWTKAVDRACGFEADKVQVEPEDWDEQRLRRLCARHGWDFEWMTEDGERLRRAGLVQSSPAKPPAPSTSNPAAPSSAARPDGSRDLPK